MTKKILLMGAGGHCEVVIDALNAIGGYVISGIFDKEEKIGRKVLDVPVVATDEELTEYFKRGFKYCFITVGSVGDPALRIKLYEDAKKIGFTIPNIIHPKAIVSERVDLGEGNFISAGTIINTGTKIGNNCIINTGAILDHNCVIEDQVHVATGAVLSGGVKIGKGTHVGAGSSIIQYASVGENTLIGLGSVVTKDIPGNVIAYGAPCEVIRNK